MAVSILVADAHRLMADALAKILNLEQDFDVCDDVPGSGQELLEAAGRVMPHVVVLDYWLPGMEAAAATRMLLSRSPMSKVLLLAWLSAPDQIRSGLEAGAVGFLSKSITVDQLAQAIRRADAGESPVFEKQLDQMITSMTERARKDDKVWERLVLLTGREIEILKLLDRGRLIEQIAKDLDIKPSTVRNHIHNILEKTHTQTHLQALAMARHHGLIVS